MSTKLQQATDSVDSTAIKQIGKFLGVLFLFSLVFFVALLMFAAMGRQGSTGSLLLAIILIGGANTGLHYALSRRGW
ncbi:MULTISPECIES: hypothetical protein [Salinibaculum]|uniref:hypothetical protein n=1 Tax=Salinibaculum TaxID=2732368 RepID=UPI0030CE6826